MTLPTASTPAGRSVGTKTPSDSSYSMRAPAWARSEYAGCRPPDATTRSQPISSPSRTSRRTRPLRPCAASSRGRASRRSRTLATSIPTSLELVRDGQRVVVRTEDDSALAGPDREVADQPAYAVGEHHADEVVPREHERLLARTGRDDDPLRAEAVEHRSGVDRDEPALPDPERASRCEHLDAASRARRDADPRRRARRRARPSPPRPRRHVPQRHRRRRARARGGARCRTGGCAPRADRASRARRRCAGTSRTAATPRAAG